MATETRTQHTPGPWTAHSGSVYKDGPNVWPKGDEIGIPIAHMDREAGNGTLPTERDANARLIAAAPTTATNMDALLEAAEAFEKSVDMMSLATLRSGEAGAIRSLAFALRAAIKQARP